MCVKSHDASGVRKLYTHTHTHTHTHTARDANRETEGAVVNGEAITPHGDGVSDLFLVLVPLDGRCAPNSQKSVP